MKTLRNGILQNAAGIAGIGIVLLMLLTVSCGKEEVTPVIADESSDVSLKSATTLNGTYELEGSTHFPAYAVKEHRVISPYELNTLYCEAVLIIEDRSMTLETTEYFGTIPYRMIHFTGHISAGGAIKFSWPDTWHEMGVEKSIEELDDQILEHTGCVVYGPGNSQGIFRTEYTGKFDGDKLDVSTHFMGKQVQFGVVPIYSEEVLGTLIEGPIQFNFSIELAVAGV